MKVKRCQSKPGPLASGGGVSMYVRVKQKSEIVPTSSQGLVLCLIDMAKDGGVLEIGFGPTE